jgi:hypothetical protein
MSWRIVQTTDNQHIGVVFEFIEAGQVLTFIDGDVVPISQTFLSEDGKSIIAYNENYHMRLIKE